MAKRKRLKTEKFTRIPIHSNSETPSEKMLEEKANYPFGVAPRARAPIAQVAGDAAVHAALEELVNEVEAAKSNGRMVEALPISEIKADHLFRDRMVVEPEDMSALKSSLQARGQQTPIEVIALDTGGYGLISGWRRLTALTELQAETGEERFGTVLALVKPIETVADSYLAMVEENEIRADLSFYERARLASEAARLQIYPDSNAAVRALFTSGSRARRSKINSFVRLHEALGADLKFPTHIPERLGLALVKSLESDWQFGARVKSALERAEVESPQAERAVLETCLKPDARDSKKATGDEVVPDLFLQSTSQRITLSGPAVTDALLRDLVAWLKRD